jgi:hypothetical protein
MAAGAEPWVARIGALAMALAVLPFLFAEGAYGGGPRWVAGSSYFKVSRMGLPVVWSSGKVTYYTDQSDLSAEVSQSQANAMVAAAAAVWNGVPTAAVAIQYGGNLAEDVDQAIGVNPNGGITLPADVQPSATQDPVAVVYDETGAVIDGIYGQGASSALECETNGVLAAADNFATTGYLAHAVILVNGQCATTADQMEMLQYQLIRAFGYVLGLGWSETNEDAFNNKQITDTVLAGWPIMHPVEWFCGAGGGECMPNPTQLRTDDVATLNRLYPVTNGNLASFPGKTLTANATVSVHGTIQFPRGQGMQGVNVVMRPLVKKVPQVEYTATAVSGEYFQGNAGNRVTGTADAGGNALTKFGSTAATQEGYFDLRYVPLPPGMTSATYQITFEPVNPLYTGKVAVGPYTTGQVNPSGTMPTITVTLKAGASPTENVTIEDAADEAQSGADGSESSPAGVPESGQWTARMTGLGHSGWFQWWARSNREFTVEAQALDESGAESENKAQLVIGAWNETDAVGTTAVTGTVQPFNGSVAGLTTLPVLTVADSEVRIGLADLRGDGRPDYAYRGRVLYADSVTPARLPAAGGQIVIKGMGFGANCVVLVNSQAAQVTSMTPNTIVATGPPSGGVTGVVLVEVEDTQTLGVAAIEDGLSYDAQGEDAISLVRAPMGSVPMGVAEPFTVKAMDVTKQAPAAGDTVTFTVTEGTAALGCGQGTCSVTTGGDGTATLMVTANATALAQMTASLTDGSTVLAEFAGATPPAIVALTPNLYLTMGATVQWPVQAVVLTSAGAPLGGQNVVWTAEAAGITVGISQSTSDVEGTAANQIGAGPFSMSVAATANACLAGTNQCVAFTVTAVDPQTATLAAGSGTSQDVPAGQALAPVVLQVTDAFGNALVGATVILAQTLYAWTEPCATQGPCPPAPVLARQTLQMTSDIHGMVTVTPLSAGEQPARLLILAATGSASVMNLELDAHP